MPDLAYASALLVVADTPAASARATAAAAIAGVPVAASIALKDVAAHFPDGAAPNLVFVELDDSPDEAQLDAVLLHLEAAAGRFASIVSTPSALIDLVAARTPHPRIVQLADATDSERAAAIVEAQRPQASIVRETPALPPLPETPAAEDDQALAAQIRRTLRHRRLRARYFDPALFADPAWDMLLDLMAARLARTRVAVSSLCIAAAVPPTTALRWIKTLTDCGLVVRHADPADGRRVFVDLADEAATRLGAYLAAVRAS